MEDFVVSAQVALALAREGHNVAVKAKDGKVTLTINKHVLMLHRLEEELTAIRTDLIKAFNTRDLELLLSHCDTNVIANWPNGQSAVGHDGVRKVIDELLGAEQPLIASYTTDPVVETRNVLTDGKTVVSSGKFNDEYVLNRPKGQKVRLDSH